MRSGAWERGGGAWGLPARGLAGGGGRDPQIVPERRGQPRARSPLGCAWGQPDPSSPRAAAAWPRGHELWGSQPGRGLRGEKPPWGTAEGPSTALGSCWQSCPRPPAAPRGVGTPAARWVRGCTLLLACVWCAWGQGLGTCASCLGSGRGCLRRAWGRGMGHLHGASEHTTGTPLPCSGSGRRDARMGLGCGGLCIRAGVGRGDVCVVLEARTRGPLHGTWCRVGPLAQCSGWGWGAGVLHQGTWGPNYWGQYGRTSASG